MLDSDKKIAVVRKYIKGNIMWIQNMFISRYIYDKHTKKETNSNFKNIVKSV